MASPDELLDAFVAAWRAGDAPDAGEWIDRAAPADQDELADLIGGYLLVADDVEPTDARRAELEAEPLVARLVAIADTAPSRPAAEGTPAWGARLRAARERAGIGLEALAERFTASFGLSASADRARRYLADLEGGDLDPRSVSSRASFRLEELLGVAAGSLMPPTGLQFRATPSAPRLAREQAYGTGTPDRAVETDDGAAGAAGAGGGEPPRVRHPEGGDPPAAAPRSRTGDAQEPTPEVLHDLESEEDVADLLRLAADALVRPDDHEWDELDELLRGG